MVKIIKVRKGLDIRIAGIAEKILQKAQPSRLYAVKPTDFHGIQRPKLLVKSGQEVKAGTPLFFDKKQPDVMFTAPVSGEVKAVNRGERRKILEVVIEAAGTVAYEDFGKSSPEECSEEEIRERLLKSGIWPSIIQRPYAVVANPEYRPRDIYVSCFDTAPLAPDLDFAVKGEGEDFDTGVRVLRKLTGGNVHLGLNADYPPSNVFTEVRDVVRHYFHGPHPAGNPGIQIHHTVPVNKGERVWHIHPQDVIIMGRLFRKGVYDPTRVIALTGSGIKKRIYYRLIKGACVDRLVDGNVIPGDLRYISGNVLTGRKISKKGYLGYYDSQVSVIPEGNKHEFLGWLNPGFNKYSNSRSFLSWLQPDRAFDIDTNLKGGQRAFIMTGWYEKVLPMDILPMQLLKAIIIGDIDQMEKLGIYEVAEEDFALCEFVCPSKTEIQTLIRKGIDMMISEMT